MAPMRSMAPFLKHDEICVCWFCKIHEFLLASLLHVIQHSVEQGYSTRYRHNIGPTEFELCNGVLVRRVWCKSDVEQEKA